MPQKYNLSLNWNITLFTGARGSAIVGGLASSSSGAFSLSACTVSPASFSSVVFCCVSAISLEQGRIEHKNRNQYENTYNIYNFMDISFCRFILS
jgi:hypothetical protein